MKLIKGDTTEAQIKHIDMILSRFSRRLHKTTAAVVSPTLVPSFKKKLDDDVCLSAMFPVDGTILVGAIYVGSMCKAGVDIHAVASGDFGSRKKSMFTKRQLTIVRPDIEVPAFSRVEIKMIPRDDGEVFDVWSSIMWAPEIRGAVVKQFVIDELNKAEEEYALLKEG